MPFSENKTPEKVIFILIRTIYLSLQNSPFLKGNLEHEIMEKYILQFYQKKYQFFTKNSGSLISVHNVLRRYCVHVVVSSQISANESRSRHRAHISIAFFSQKRPRWWWYFSLSR